MKDVASSFADFTILSKNAHNVPSGHPAREDLKKKARVETLTLQCCHVVNICL